MSFFAGVVALDGQREIPDEIADSMVRALSRHPGDEPRLHRVAGCLLSQVVLPSESQAMRYDDASGSVTLLAGAPLFREENADAEVRTLHEALRLSDEATLARARGSYCAAHWDARARRLSLIADKLGLRPIYFGVEQGLLIFSTALRVLESIGVPALQLDVRGVAEIASFGYPLAARSPYEAIRVIEASAIVRTTGDGVQSHPYWHWDRLPSAGIAPQELPQAMFEAFRGAIDRRLRGQRDAVAGLSGGLDSRCLVAGLRLAGARVHTVNFAPRGSEDLVLGRLAAQALGSVHFEFPIGPLEFWDRMRAAHKAWLEQTSEQEMPQHPHRLWSGDGGSCGMGHIYLNDRVIELMSRGNTEAAIDTYLQLNTIALPGRLLTNSQRERLVGYPREGVRAELERLGAADPARRMHLYLMLNGQRRMLANHYENIDLRRFELITPFFDSDLLQLVLTSPIEGFLAHRFYNRWLEEFQPEVRSVPWQAYPGHVPCPVAKPSGLRNQWDRWYDKEGSGELAKRALTQADELLRDPHFPAHLLNRHVLWLARRLTGLGLGDYRHIFKCAETFTRYSRPN